MNITQSRVMAGAEKYTTSLSFEEVLQPNTSLAPSFDKVAKHNWGIGTAKVGRLTNHRIISMLRVRHITKLVKHLYRRQDLNSNKFNHFYLDASSLKDIVPIF